MVIKFHLMENNTIVLRKPYPKRKKKRGNISQKRGSKAFNGTFVNQFWQHLQKKPFLLVDYGSFVCEVSKFKQTNMPEFLKENGTFHNYQDKYFVSKIVLTY